jgi:1-acyl-sn-glycerol-3-phosphate acyltransferase
LSLVQESGAGGGPTSRPWTSISRAFRAAWRVPTFVALTLLLGLPTLASRRLPGRLAPHGLRFRRFALRGWAQAFLRIANVDLEVVGKAPDPPFFLVSNHLSYVDIILLCAVLEDAVFVAQHEVESWPIIGTLAGSVDTIFVNRSELDGLREVNQNVARSLAEGRSIVLFPEGTSTKGLQVERFLSPVLAPAVEAGMPVHACAIDYRTLPDEAPAHMAICWWGDMTFADHALALFQLPGFQARLRFVAEPVLNGNRKELARSLQKTVAGAFSPTAPGEAACLIDS